MSGFSLNINEYLQDAGSRSRCGFYHGWQIDVCQDGDQFFTFQCYPPDIDDFLDSGEDYPDFSTALQAAQEFVDREIAIRALLDVMNEWLWQGIVDEDEYWLLTNFE